VIRNSLRLEIVDPLKRSALAAIMQQLLPVGSSALRLILLRATETCNCDIPRPVNVNKNAHFREDADHCILLQASKMLPNTRHLHPEQRSNPHRPCQRVTPSDDHRAFLPWGSSVASR
jgi:hypothetical protein